MIVRLWRTKIVLTRIEEYKRFEQEHSLPMFRRQTGFLGVLFLGHGETHAVLSLWKDTQAVEALDTSPTYQQTVQKILAKKNN